MEYDDQSMQVPMAAPDKGRKFGGTIQAWVMEVRDRLEKSSGHGDSGRKVSLVGISQSGPGKKPRGGG